MLDMDWARAVLKTMPAGICCSSPTPCLLAQPFLNYSAYRCTLGMNLKDRRGLHRRRRSRSQTGDRTVRGEPAPAINATPKPVAQVLQFGDATITYGLFYWLDDYGRRWLEIHDALSTRIWEAFRQEKFELPFPLPSRAIAVG